jgi:hypothetical protein
MEPILSVWDEDLNLKTLIRPDPILKYRMSSPDPIFMVPF